MPSSKPPIWRNDIDALAFQPGEHIGLCMVHRRAFRTMLRATPSPQQCVEFFNAHQEAFQAAARTGLLRAHVAATANFHLTSRDVSRQLKIWVALTALSELKMNIFAEARHATIPDRPHLPPAPSIRALLLRLYWRWPWGFSSSAWSASRISARFHNAAHDVRHANAFPCH